MTINNPIKFCSGLWDWSILDGCFGDTKIKPTDIDGLVERHGKFLVLETKTPGAFVPQGQMKMFQAMVKTQAFTVFIIWGKDGEPEEIQVLTRHEIHDKEICNVEKLRELVLRWFEFANKTESEKEVK